MNRSSVHQLYVTLKKLMHDSWLLKNNITTSNNDNWEHFLDNSRTLEFNTNLNVAMTLQKKFRHFMSQLKEGSWTEPTNNIKTKLSRCVWRDSRKYWSIYFFFTSFFVKHKAMNDDDDDDIVCEKQKINFNWLMIEMK